MAPRQERKQASTGSRLIMIGAPFVVIGLVLALLLNGNTLGIGVAIAVLGALPVVAGLALLLSAGTQRRVRKDKPFV
jgi:multidrug efflux pump subunit AcrB